MAGTQADLTAAEAAYAEMMLGVRVGEVTINGKSIKYKDISPIDLLNYINSLKISLGTTIPRAYARNKKRATL